MRLQNPFAVVSTTGLDSQVLSVLARSDQYLPVQQIHRLLPEEGSPQGVRKSVVRLAAQGTLLERRTGRSLAYALNRDHLLVAAMLQIADAKRELLARMAQVIATWPSQPLSVKIFGSAARDEMRSESDIDVLIVMPDSTAEGSMDEPIAELAMQVSLWTGNDVRPLVYRADEVQPMAVFSDILDDGIDIAGDPSWLRRRLRDAKALA